MQPKKIIVVDDSRSARLQVVCALQHENVVVIEAVDGRDGLVKIEEHRDAGLVLCDVNMPEMNGMEMLAELHARGWLAQLPVIMLTTESEPDMLQRAKNAGAKGWVVKPFKPALLLSTVRRLLSLDVATPRAHAP